MPLTQSNQHVLTNSFPSGYFRQHWQGMHSLARSFWINTVLLWFMFYNIWNLFDKYSTELGVSVSKTPIVHSLSLDIMPWGFALLLTSWQLGGLFRSASTRLKTAQTPWSRLEARAVQSCVGVAFLASGYVLAVNAVPSIVDGSLVIMEDISDKYTINVINGGTELEIQGYIRYGLTEEVKHYIDLNRGIRVIRLNSDGGRYVEGVRLRNLVRLNKLTTYSSIGCSSACATAFIGGTKRYLNKHAHLGFHLIWYPAEPYPGAYNENRDDWSRRERSYLLAAGVDPQYVEKLLSSLTYDIFCPPLDELLKAGVVHGLSETVNLTLPQ